MEKQTGTMEERKQKQQEKVNSLNILLQEHRLKYMYRNIKILEILKSIWMTKKLELTPLTQKLEQEKIKRYCFSQKNCLMKNIR